MLPQQNNLSVIITAAGNGERFNQKQKKQFIEFKGTELLTLNIKKWISFDFIINIYLVLPIEGFEENSIKYKSLSNKIITVLGGKSRTESISNALNVIENCKKVLIHDGVRPFFTKNLIYSVINALNTYKAVIPALKVTDTIKEISENVVVKTINRTKYATIQTPQGFDFDLIYYAYKTYGNIDFYDDSSLIELLNESVFTVEGEWNNIKVTEQSQIPLINYLTENFNDKDW